LNKQTARSRSQQPRRETLLYIYTKPINYLRIICKQVNEREPFSFQLGKQSDETVARLKMNESVALALIKIQPCNFIFEHVHTHKYKYTPSLEQITNYYRVYQPIDDRFMTTHNYYGSELASVLHKNVFLTDFLKRNVNFGIQQILMSE